MNDPTKSGTAGAVAGVAVGAAVGAAVTYGMAEQAEQRIAELLEQALATLRAEHEKLLSEVHDLRAQLEASGAAAASSLADDADRHVQRVGEEVTAHVHRVDEHVGAIETQLRSRIDQSAEDLFGRIEHTEEALGQRLHDRVEGLGHDLDQRARSALQGIEERVAGARQELESTGSQLVQTFHDEGGRVRDAKLKLRSSLEDVVQVLVGAVPAVGPYLSNLADNIDPAD